tara:strand:+ start:7737 stop:8549 length:813 start_codon:yes stop_codon:yes gene_type:complete
MIFYPKSNQDISEYTLAIIASNNVYNYLKQHVFFLRSAEIKFKNLVIGDAGLLEKQKEEIVDGLGEKVSFVEFEDKNYDTNFKTQSNEYRKIIDNRVQFLKDIFLDKNTERVVQLDADTAIIQNNFKMLDKTADVSLTVRPVTPYDHILGQFQVDYPNCGVIFWNNPTKSIPFLNHWEEYKQNNPAKGGQYEQNYFLHACLDDSFTQLNVQKIHCAYYNCYNADWLNQDTSILHYKGNSKLFGPGGGNFESRSDYLNMAAFGKKLRFEQE